MGSPKRPRRDQDRRGDIRDRLQTLATKPSDAKKKSNSLPRNSTTSRSNAREKDKLNDSRHNSNRKDSVERSRLDRSHRLAKRLDGEDRHAERWGHSGFRELYKEELGIKNRLSRSREKISPYRTVSRDNVTRRLNAGTRERRSSVGGGTNRSVRKRSHSSSDRAVDERMRLESERKRLSRNGFASSNKPLSKKPEEQRPTESKRTARRNSLSRSPQKETKSSSTKKVNEKRMKRDSPTPRDRSRSPLRSKASPTRLRRHHSSMSGSSSSQSGSSRSSSSSSSSVDSSSSSSSQEPARQSRPIVTKSGLTLGPRSKIKLEGEGASRNKITKRKPPGSHPSADSDSSSDSSSSYSEEMEEEDPSKDTRTRSSTNSGQNAPPQRLSLSERFGKLAQLSSQRRNFDMVQLRIVSGANSSEKSVSVDETKSAPVLYRPISSLDQIHQDHHQMNSVGSHIHEEPVRKDDRSRDDRWRDWHERYEDYRHVQPPRQLPRDWDDINVRHKYYTERGFFGHDMTLEDLSRWEEWWHRYQSWRRGYESAWIKMHGPNVPVEYPVEYQSTGHLSSRDPAHYRHHSPPPTTQATPVPSIRSRLGWRR